MLAGIAQQQRSGVDELGGRRLSAVRECFQPAAFFFGEGNLISGCHAPIIHQRKSVVIIRNVTCYLVLVSRLHGSCSWLSPGSNRGAYPTRPGTAPDPPRILT